MAAREARDTRQADRAKIAGLSAFGLKVGPGVPIGMPKDSFSARPLSGLSVINSIRQTIAPETLPIIVLSAASQSQLEQIRTRFPNVQVLQKPCGIKTLLRLIEMSHVADKP